MDDGPSFAKDLYRGTSEDYERFRLRYPEVMVEDLVGRVRPSGAGRLMDLACGTGQLAFSLRAHFVETWAVDLEADMIGVVEAKATAAGWGDVRPVVSSGEDLEAPTGCFELVTIGNAFHRLHRDRVAARTYEWLTPGGHLAICWSDVPWLGPLEWQQALCETLERWKVRLGAGDRIPTGWESPRRRRPDLEVLADAGFIILGRHKIPVEHRWRVQDLIGFVYGTSFLPRVVVGDSAPAFEADVEDRVGRLAHDGTLSQTVTFAFELGQRPHLP